MPPYLIPLVTAHVLGDFLLQPDWMAGGTKKKPGILALHALIHGLLAFLLVGRLELWPVAVLILLSHAFIDFIKLNSPWPNTCSSAPCGALACPWPSPR